MTDYNNTGDDVDPKPKPVAREEGEYYNDTLSPNPDEVDDADNEQKGDADSEDTGGTVDKDTVADQGKGPSTPGTPGHPGIDEDTG